MKLLKNKELKYDCYNYRFRSNQIMGDCETG